jgi:surfeit locus 1 family protein
MGRLARVPDACAVSRSLIPPLILGLIGAAVLVSLGAWQLRRLEWKTAILAEIDARLAADPVPVPRAPDPVADRYLRVRAEGTLLPGEIHVYTAGPGGGVGYRIVAPLALADGRRILLDRGFVPIEAKDAPRQPGPVRVTGNLAWPDEGPPRPDVERNIWIARDVDLMAEALGTGPVLLVAAASDAPEPPTPQPVTPNISNDHLGYAITWFGLAAVWAMMTALWLWRIKRRID